MRAGRQILTAANWDAYVPDEHKHVVVEFYAPWSVPPSLLAPTVQQPSRAAAAVARPPVHPADGDRPVGQLMNPPTAPATPMPAPMTAPMSPFAAPTTPRNDGESLPLTRGSLPFKLPSSAAAGGLGGCGRGQCTGAGHGVCML